MNGMQYNIEREREITLEYVVFRALWLFYYLLLLLLLVPKLKFRYSDLFLYG